MRITDITTYLVPMSSSWLTEGLIANPMSIYPRYREKRSSWYGPMTSAIVAIDTDEGIRGLGIVGGGKAKLAPTIIEEQFKNLLIGQNPFDMELLRSAVAAATAFAFVSNDKSARGGRRKAVAAATALQARFHSDSEFSS